MSLYDHAKFGDDRPNGLGVHKEHTHRQTDRLKPLIILKEDITKIAYPVQRKMNASKRLRS